MFKSIYHSYFNRSKASYEPLSTTNRASAESLPGPVSDPTWDLDSTVHAADAIGTYEAEQSSVLAEPSNRPRSKANRIDYHFLSFLFCVFALAANLLLYAKFGGDPDPSYEENVNMHLLNRVRHRWGRPLRKPSQFRGVDKLQRTALTAESGGRSIVNFPILIARVDGSFWNRGKVITRGPGSRSFDTHSGFEARVVEVNGSISTVLQFRTIDWGMEKCDLVIQLPISSSSSRWQTKITPPDEPPHFDIFQLSSVNTVFDLDSLSHSSLPRFDSKVGSVLFNDQDLDPNSPEPIFKWSYEFPCPMDSVSTFILTSVIRRDGKKVGGGVKWWQDKQSLLPAVFVRQYATEGDAIPVSYGRGH